MDRRSAIKKLAVGGTVGSAVILTQPAFAGASPGRATLSVTRSVTSEGVPLVYTVVAEVGSLSVSCSEGGTAGVSYEWKKNSTFVSDASSYSFNSANGTTLVATDTWSVKVTLTCGTSPVTTKSATISETMPPAQASPHVFTAAFASP